MRPSAGGALRLRRRPKPSSAEAADRGRRLKAPARTRRILAAVGALAVCGLLLGALASWHFSSRVLVPDHSGWPEDIAVEAVTPRAIALERSEETMRPGVYGLVWQSGSAIAGQVLSSDEDTVTRRLRKVRGYLVAGAEVGINSSVFSGTPMTARGIPYREVSFDGELGPLQAWEIPAPRRAEEARTWAIVVHGINDSPQVGLRLAPTLRRSGLTSLLITYREDLGAPQSPDGFHHMGLTEWRDLQSAARHALAEGARRLILIGYSMGGSLVTQFMQHSALARRAAGLVLDAPALSWQRILGFNATQMGLPAFASKPVEWAVGARIDADWEDLDALRHSDDLQLPILLFHGLEDGLIPIDTSDELAEANPEWVTYFRVPDAGHTQSWNVAPRLYEQRVSAFLDRALANAKSPALGRAR